MGELSIHRWKGFELYPVINKKTVSCKVGEKDAVLFKISRDAGVFSKAIDLLFAK